MPVRHWPKREVTGNGWAKGGLHGNQHQRRPRQGEPFGHRGVAATFDPSLFRTFYLATPNAGIKQATCRRGMPATLIDGGITGPDAKPPISFYAGHYPELF